MDRRSGTDLGVAESTRVFFMSDIPACTTLLSMTASILDSLIPNLSVMYFENENQCTNRRSGKENGRSHAEHHDT